MKKLFMKLAIYAVSLSVLTLAINWCYFYMTEKHRKINVPDGIEICNFGSSHGLASFKFDDVTFTTASITGIKSNAELVYLLRYLTHHYLANRKTVQKVSSQ